MSSPYLGLDIGTKRTGVSYSENGLLAEPIGIIEGQPPHRHQIVTGITKIVEERGIKTLVIGLPLVNGGATQQSAWTELVIFDLHNALDPANVEIVAVDEAFSTYEAIRHYKDVDKDSAAAAIILQNYLDSLS
jgi:putative transcription antitermination factor YqgF